MKPRESKSVIHFMKIMAVEDKYVRKRQGAENKFKISKLLHKIGFIILVKNKFWDQLHFKRAMFPNVGVNVRPCSSTWPL